MVLLQGVQNNNCKFDLINVSTSKGYGYCWLKQVRHASYKARIDVGFSRPTFKYKCCLVSLVDSICMFTVKNTVNTMLETNNLHARDGESKTHLLNIESKENHTLILSLGLAPPPNSSNG